MTRASSNGSTSACERRLSSTQYEGRDETCPVSSKKGGGLPPYCDSAWREADASRPRQPHRVMVPGPPPSPRCGEWRVRRARRRAGARGRGWRRAGEAGGARAGAGAAELLASCGRERALVCGPSELVARLRPDLPTPERRRFNFALSDCCPWTYFCRFNTCFISRRSVPSQRVSVGSAGAGRCSAASCARGRAGRACSPVITSVYGHSHFFLRAAMTCALSGRRQRGAARRGAASIAPQRRAPMRGGQRPGADLCLIVRDFLRLDDAEHPLPEARGEGAAQPEAPHLLLQLEGERAHDRAVGLAAALPDGRADRPMARTTRALLAPRLLPAARDHRARLGRA